MRHIYCKLRRDTYEVPTIGWDSPYGGTLLTMGLDSSVLRSEVSFGHFGTGAEMSGHFRSI